MIKIKFAYGLKQAPKVWNEEFNVFMAEVSFKRSKSDYCLYTYFVQNIRSYLLLYVDDILLMSNSIEVLNYLKSKLCEKFKMKSLAKVDNVLRICRDLKNRISIDQNLSIKML